MDRLIGGGKGAKNATGGVADGVADRHMNGAGPDPVKDGDQRTFRQDVLEASMQVPVIVDFWATWCGPCKQLGPTIEKAVRAAQGNVRLVKIDVDQNQELAAQMQIQSIPAVYAFYQGRPVDGFVGAQPESQLKQFVERLAQLAGKPLGPSPIDEALDEGDAALAAGNHEAASDIYGQVHAHDPENARAIAGILRAFMAAGALSEARDFLAHIPQSLLGDPAIVAARAQLDLATEGGKAKGEAPALRARISANPKDFEARYTLSQALFASGDKEEALEQLLEIVRLNRSWNEEAARKQLVKLFEAMGPTDPLTLAGRRRLSSLLFS